ncbi:transglutaminase-like domain-containing protein [Serpentinicella alkaliphila]|uniref:Uncharacterized protein n=1 Tax=Serpentinicella alkaliphila TaxID=1734049 RepID=A0A4R2U3G0_9FIRM|nr:transglutaminase-like domain-containing protein [Serpentinicella alkaliphila]QUH24528.1 hypothetical protein HZR23_01095 [Serpentinicella alkaliphila]TCQ04619.1 hypothetical protein EDD79_100622 [Serpentinicella alkaliphila]
MLKRILIVIVCILVGSIGNFTYAAENINPKFKSLDSIERYIVSQLSERNPISEFDIISSDLISQIIAGEKAELLLDTVNRAIAKSPYNLYSYSTLEYGLDGFTDRITVKYTIGYMTTPEQERDLAEAVKRVLKEIITDNMSDIEKIKAVNNFIVLNTEYNLDYAGNPYSPHTVMFKGQGVCQGYLCWPT